MPNLSISITKRVLNNQVDIIHSINNKESNNGNIEEGNKIVLLVAKYSKISPELIMHHSRCRSNIADARQLAMYLVHVYLGYSMTAVGGFFGRDRTTVSHACARVEDRRDEIEYDDFVCKIECELDLGEWKSLEVV